MVLSGILQSSVCCFSVQSSPKPDGFIPCPTRFPLHAFLFFFFYFVLLLCWVGVHCSIYKGSYNVSNISYLNSPPPLCSHFSNVTHLSLLSHPGLSVKVTTVMLIRRTILYPPLRCCWWDLLSIYVPPGAVSFLFMLYLYIRALGRHSPTWATPLATAPDYNFKNPCQYITSSRPNTMDKIIQIHLTSAEFYFSTCKIKTAIHFTCAAKHLDCCQYQERGSYFLLSQPCLNTSTNSEGC
jgi:hypothetical protein